MREALEELESGISIGGRRVTNLRYADDTTLLAGTKEDLIELVERVRRASEKAGLYLNVGKTKVMTTGDIGEVTVGGKDITEASWCHFVILFLFVLPTLKLVKSTLKLVKPTLKLVKSTLKLEKSTLISIKSTLKLVKSTLKLVTSTFNVDKINFLMSEKSTLKLVKSTLKLEKSTLMSIKSTLKLVKSTF